MPRHLPRLAPLPLIRVREVVDHPEWLFEIKHDGFRALAYVRRGQTRLVSRNGNTFARFAPLCSALAHAVKARSAILDASSSASTATGVPSSTRSSSAAPCFVAFDLLWLDGVDLRDRPLLERKRTLRRVIPKRSTSVLYLGHVRGRGVDLFRAACEHDLEGIVAKPARSAYRVLADRSPGSRSKIPTTARRAIGTSCSTAGGPPASLRAPSPSSADRCLGGGNRSRTRRQREAG